MRDAIPDQSPTEVERAVIGKQVSVLLDTVKALGLNLREIGADLRLADPKEMWRVEERISYGFRSRAIVLSYVQRELQQSAAGERMASRRDTRKDDQRHPGGSRCTEGCGRVSWPATVLEPIRRLHQSQRNCPTTCVASTGHAVAVVAGKNLLNQKVGSFRAVASQSGATGAAAAREHAAARDGHAGASRQSFVSR
ncbi:MAG: hypothetical protein MZW92_03595 [Comamonadaceae bacterium]|nr:hypothetical protein [Comamonadaceae bacterium]